MFAVNRLATVCVWLWQAQGATAQQQTTSAAQQQATPAGPPPAASPAPLPSAPPPDAPTAAKVDWYARIWDDYINRQFHIGDTLKVSLATLVLGILIFVSALIVSRWLRRLIQMRFAAHKRIDAGLQYTILRLTHYFIVALGAVLALRAGFNADFTSLAVVFGALSIGAGFGLQYIANDLASGFILLFERPVRVGDFVTVGVDSKTVEGKVKSIKLRTTLVMTNDRIAVIVPNSQLVSHNLINWSNPDARSRISVTVGVASDSDPDLVTRTLLKAAEGVEHVLAEPKPSVQFTGFGDFTNDFRLMVWTEHPRRHPKIKSDINYRIFRLFKEARIEIPNPQRELTIRGGALHVDTNDDGDRRERDDSYSPDDYARADREATLPRR